MKKIFFIAAVLWASVGSAQVKHVSLQASGLTCSMCSKAIYKSLKTIDFVDQVEPDIASSTFNISFKPGMAVNFDLLKKKVEDAGFAVADFSATIHFDQLSLTNDEHVAVGGMMFHFLKVKDQVIDGDQAVKILDKGFVSAKVYKANSKLTLMECYKTGVMESCCSKGIAAKGSRVFHVTI